LDWATRPQEYYAETLGVSTKTIQTLTRGEPFVTKCKSKDGGGLRWLVRVGQKVQDADDWRRILSKVWRDWQENPPAWALTKPNKGKDEAVSYKDGACFWYLAQDLPGELALALLKYAIKNQETWTKVATAAKLAGEGVTGYKIRYWDFPNVGLLRRFYRAAFNAYVMDVQEGNIKPPEGWEALNKPAVSAAILQLTDPLDPTPDKAIETKRAVALRDLLAKLQTA
jgi:hypothetical protein